MAEPKIYAPMSAKQKTFTNGGHVIKFGGRADKIIDWIRQHTNQGGYINFVMAERREVGQYGDTHTVSLDAYVPKPKAEPPIEIDEDSIPF